MNNTIQKSTIDETIEFYSIIRDLLNNETVQKMKFYKQHYDTSTYEHCFYVSYICFKMCKHLHLDYKSAARAAMLHDLFLYDWRNSKKKLNLKGYHAFVHPKIALENANKIFDLNNKEKDIIEKHMWPVTFFSFPKYPETVVITLADKYSALHESYKHYYNFLTKRKVIKYAYLFLCLLIFI